MTRQRFLVEPMGDRAALVTVGSPGEAVAVSRALSAMAGTVEEAWPAFAFVGVALAAGVTLEDLAERLAGVSLHPGVPTAGRDHVVPVCYGLGEDLAEVARLRGLSPEAVARSHAKRYTCLAVGFQPGFAYLGGLADPLAGLPRRAEPRARVEPGSVGIAGEHTGVYAWPSPGGWWIVGRTPLTLVDPAEGYFPIAVGDTVEFEPIDEAEFDRLCGERL